ncbi:NUDIX hydrolase [Peterkaempfera griseoplana]|uniref:NUDIX hydrolase n=1 Tax=Peterkaempfera griseoplana TaxID=66896 RepID=UPI0006E24AC7|nr:NUDIX hydrolase [Peterkaempfera griseoplana]
MIIWVNGTFGAGKSSACRELTALLPGSVLYDPEPVGAALAAMLPRDLTAGITDYQDLPSWRLLVPEVAAALLAEVPGPLVVPMTLLRQEYRDEIFGALAARRIPVHHVLLHADETILRARIESRAADPAHPARGEETRRWSLDHLAAYQQALPWLTADAETIDTATLTPRAVAERIAALVRRGTAQRRIVQTPEPTADTVASAVLLFDEQDRVLLVDPVYKPGWEFPGGVVERGEAPTLAGVREVAEELGITLDRSALRLLVTDWEPHTGPRQGGIRLVYDGGRLDAEGRSRLRLPADELRSWRFVTLSEAEELLPPGRVLRLAAALRARRRGQALTLEAGVPVGERAAEAVEG